MQKAIPRISDFIKMDDWKTEKHVPVIEIPSSIKQGEYFSVNVVVGKEIPHPNTTEHHIQYISLYFKPENDKFMYHIGTSDFKAHGASANGPNTGPAYANPRACFEVKLNESGVLIAVESCNIHGVWESSQEVKF